MHVLQLLLFLLCLLLFICHQVLQKGFGISLPLLDCYLDNLLAMPLLLTLLGWERRWLFKRVSGWKLSNLEVVAATVYVIIVSEILFPWLSPAFTADWRDAVVYAFGSLVFQLTATIHTKKNEIDADFNR